MTTIMKPSPRGRGLDAQHPELRPATNFMSLRVLSAEVLDDAKYVKQRMLGYVHRRATQRHDVQSTSGIQRTRTFGRHPALKGSRERSGQRFRDRGHAPGVCTSPLASTQMTLSPCLQVARSACDTHEVDLPLKWPPRSRSPL